MNVTVILQYNENDPPFGNNSEDFVDFSGFDGFMALRKDDRKDKDGSTYTYTVLEYGGGFLKDRNRNQLYRPSSISPLSRVQIRTYRVSGKTRSSFLSSKSANLVLPQPRSWRYTVETIGKTSTTRREI